MTRLATLFLVVLAPLGWGHGQAPGRNGAAAEAPRVAAAAEEAPAGTQEPARAAKSRARAAAITEAGVRATPLAAGHETGSPPYLFASWEFVFLFLPLALSLWALARGSPRWGIGVLTAMSLLWYGLWDVRFVPLIAVSLVVNWWLGKAIARTRSRALVALAIALGLAPLAYFKYSRFLLEVVGLADAPWLPSGVLPLVLPLGISFYTFQQIAYVVDVRARPEQHEPSLARYALFVLFFPQLVAGPIVQHHQFLPQLGARRDMPAWFARGCCYFAIGVLKKLAIADPIGARIDAYFAPGACADASQALAAIVGYAVQLYFDFSAYSDMALGLGSLFGLALPINFDSPYKSRSVTEFWRRWHMTLSAFLRDYVYVPLGGNRGAPWRKYRNLMATMLLAGLWHGAGGAFVVFGAVHGACLCVEHFARTRWPSFTLGIFARPLTLSALFGSFLLFRAEDLGLAAEIAGRLAHPGWSVSTPLALVIVVALGSTLLLPNSHRIVALVSQWPRAVAQVAWSFGTRSGAYACVTLALLAFLVQGYYERQLDRTLRRVLPLGLNAAGTAADRGDLRNNLNRCAALAGPGPRWVVVGPSVAGGMPLYSVSVNGERRLVGGTGIPGPQFSNWSRAVYHVLDDPTIEVAFLSMSPYMLAHFGPTLPFFRQGWDACIALGFQRKPGPPLATLGPTPFPFTAALGALVTTSIRAPEYFQVHGFCRLLLDAATMAHPEPIELTAGVLEDARRRRRELWARAPTRPPPASTLGRAGTIAWEERGIVESLSDGGAARAGLAAIVRRAREHGITLVFYETPTAGPELAPGFIPPELWAQYGVAIRAACRDLGVEYWDLSGLLPWTDEAMQDIFHATLPGRAITLAALCERWLEEHGRGEPELESLQLAEGLR